MPGGMSSLRVVWFRYVFSIAAFPFMIVAHIALVVYDLLFMILSFSSAEAKIAERILQISSMNSVPFLPMFPVASTTKGMNRST